MAQYRNVILKDNPTAYYRLGETFLNVPSGSKTRDEGASWYDGTVTGTVTLGQVGAIRSAYNAMKFDGSTGYISLPTTGLPSGTSLWSIEAWGYTTNAAFAGYQCLAAFGNRATNAMANLLFYNGGTGGQAVLAIFGGDIMSAVGSIVSNQWYHLVGTYDGTNTNLYVNGVLAISAAHSPNITLSFASIGADGTTQVEFFIGSVDEVAIYNYTLSASQVAQHYQRGSATSPVKNYPQTILADTPIRYYRLEETSGTTTVDLGSQAQNGTLHGTVTLAQPGAVANDPNAAMLFDGSTGYIALPSGLNPHGFLNGGFAQVSVECWMKLSTQSFAQTARLLANDNTGTTNNGIDMTVGANGVGGNFYVGSGSANANAAWVVTFTAGVWYHLAATWDGNNIKTYVNGVLKNTTSFSSGSIGSSANPLNIGRNPAVASTYFPGVIDELAIWGGVVLSATQISNHYNAGLASTIGPHTATIGRGQPVTVVSGSLMIDRAIGRNSQASFLVKHTTSVFFQQYQTVDIYDHNSVRVFSGYILVPKTTKPGFQAWLITQVTCTDKKFLTDKRRVYNSSTNLAKTYSSTAISSIVQDIANNWLAAEYVAIRNIATVSTTINATFNWPSVTQAMDALAKSASTSGTSYYWDIDQDSGFWFQAYNATINYVVVDGTLIDQSGRMPPNIIYANPLYRNGQFLIAGSNPYSSYVQNASQITAQAAIDGSSGIIEDVVKDTTISTAADGTAEGTELINRNAIRGTRFEFTTRQTGFAPGQQITVNYAPFNLNNQTMLVENVHTADTDGINIWYTITAVVGPYDQAWAQFFGHALASPQQSGSINVGV